MNPITMKAQIDPLLLAALREDISNEDVSTNAVIREETPGEVELLAKQDGVIAGLEVFARVFTLLDERTEVTFLCKDGDAVRSGQLLGRVRGDIRVLLSGERVALNLLQRMSGIATCAREMADALQGTNTRLLDTRKTTPGLRILEKYAVRVGGGYNHRFNLSDGILLKDNHIAAAGGVREAVRLARECRRSKSRWRPSRWWMRRSHRARTSSCWTICRSRTCGRPCAASRAARRPSAPATSRGRSCRPWRTSAWTTSPAARSRTPRRSWTSP